MSHFWDLEDLYDIRKTQENIGSKRKIYKNRIDPLIVLHDQEFKYKYRFTKLAMRHIISLVCPLLQGDNRGGRIPVELMVLAAIRCWGRHKIQEDCADLHGFSQPTMSRICLKVAHAIASLSSTYIKMPKDLISQERVVKGFRSICGFPNIIDAIDCTHIKIKKVSGDIGQYYINRKGYYSLNIQVVCDSSNISIRDDI